MHKIKNENTSEGQKDIGKISRKRKAACRSNYFSDCLDDNTTKDKEENDGEISPKNY